MSLSVRLSNLNSAIYTPRLIQTISGLQIYGGPGSLSHDFNIWPITFKAAGPVDPSFLVLKNSHLNKNIILQQSMNSRKQKVHVGSQYSKTCLKQPLKIDKKKRSNKW